MTDELNEKLSELLKLKDEFENLMEERAKADSIFVTAQYEKHARAAAVRFRIGVAMSFVFVLLGVVGANSTGRFAGILVMIGAAGFFVGIAAKLGLRIMQTKLSILKEMKLFELRLMDALEASDSTNGNGKDSE